MEMQVGYGLLALLSDIGDHPIAGARKSQLLCQLGDHCEDMPHNMGILLRHRTDRLNMGLGHHQEVGRCLGGDVIKSVAQVILVDPVAGDLPGNDLAEQAVAHTIVLLSSGDHCSGTTAKNTRSAVLSLMRL